MFTEEISGPDLCIKLLFISMCITLYMVNYWCLFAVVLLLDHHFHCMIGPMCSDLCIVYICLHHIWTLKALVSCNSLVRDSHGYSKSIKAVRRQRNLGLAIVQLRSLLETSACAFVVRLCLIYTCIHIFLNKISSWI